METPPAGEPTQERVMIYSASWQLLGNDSPDVTYEVTWYHLTDALFSTVVITNHAGIVAERVSYSPYGKARHHRAADLTGDGAVNSADQLHLFNAWGDGFFADYNRDGSVDSADLLFLTTNWGAAESPGRLSTTDNTIGFAGYMFNAEFDDAGLYTVRYRHYEPELGRWLSRDPLGYVDGMGVYEYVRGRPNRYVDSSGLQAGGIGGVQAGFRYCVPIVPPYMLCATVAVRIHAYTCCCPDGSAGGGVMREVCLSAGVFLQGTVSPTGRPIGVPPLQAGVASGACPATGCQGRLCVTGSVGVRWIGSFGCRVCYSLSTGDWSVTCGWNIGGGTGIEGGGCGTCYESSC